MVVPVEALQASLTQKATGSSFPVKPGTEVPAKVEAVLPNNVLRLSVAGSQVDVRVAQPLPEGTELTLKVEGSAARPEIRLLPAKPPVQTPPPQSSPSGGNASPGGQVPASAGGGLRPNPVPVLIDGNGKPVVSQLPPTQTTAPAQGAVPPAQGSGGQVIGQPVTLVSVLTTGSTPPQGAGHAPLSSGSPPSATAPSGQTVPAGAAPASGNTQSPQSGGTAPTVSSAANSGASPQAGQTSAPSASQPGPGQATQATSPQASSATGSSASGQTGPASAGAPGGQSSPVTPNAQPPVGGAGSAQQPAQPLPAGGNVLPGTAQPAQGQATAIGAGSPAAPQQAASQSLASPLASPPTSGSTPPATPSTGPAASVPTGTGGQTTSPQGTAPLPSPPTTGSAQPVSGQPPASTGQNVQAGQSVQVGQSGQTVVPQAPAASSAPAPTATPAPVLQTPVGSQGAPVNSPAGGQTPSLPLAASPASSTPKPPTSPAQGTTPLPTAPASSASKGPTPPPSPEVVRLAKAVLPQLTEQQASLSGAFAQLASLGSRSTLGISKVPEPVQTVVQQLLGLRLGEGATGKDIQTAVKNSGLFREAALAKGQGLLPPGGGTAQTGQDIKSLLLQLRSFLKGMGIDPSHQKPLTQPPVPSLVALPRGQRPTLPNNAPDGDEIQQLSRLLSDTDAALSRIRLTQMVSRGMADDGVPQQAGRAMDVVVELPISLGQETGVLQMQVGRDPDKGKDDETAEPGWRLRFALDLTATGPLEAAVSLRGGGTYVSLWMDRSETFAAISAERETMEATFAHAGLDLKELRFLRGLPQKTEARFGVKLDRTS